MSELIAILDDEPEILRLLSDALEGAGFRTARFRRAADFTAAAARLAPSVCLIDLSLPDRDGLSVVYEMAQDQGAAVIIISGRTNIQDKVTGLGLGADDYIVKPFDPAEVVARVQVALRRREPPAIASEQAVFAGRAVDFRGFVATMPDGETASLSRAEADLLRLFLERPNRLLSREDIHARVGGGARGAADRAIDVRVSRLRSKLGDDPKNPTLIKTIYGAGYLFVGDVDWS